MVAVIFLDIDGVICCNMAGRLEEQKLANLNDIVKATQAKVVLSTDWRRQANLKRQVIATLKRLDIEVIGATENNLKNVHLKVPLGTITCVTGVSGSGKSTLVDDVLRRRRDERRRVHRADDRLREVKLLGVVAQAVEVDAVEVGLAPERRLGELLRVERLVREGRGVHPAVVISEDPEAGLKDPTMIWTLIIAGIAMALLFTWLVSLRARFAAIDDELETLHLEGESR